MAGQESLEKIYSQLTGLNSKLLTDDFYQYFLRCVKTGKNNVGLTKKVIERTLKGDWLEKIEGCVINLDNIIRNPTRYIKNLEDIVPIETARGITTESIRHLAQHTSMIAMVDDDGMVTPDRILNIVKEESYDTYENRLLYTLLMHLDYFINKRLNMIKDSGKNIHEFVLNGECFVGKEKISYRLNFACEGTQGQAKTSREELINADVSKLDVNQRIERIRRILYEFNDSPLMKSLQGCEQVRPPIHLNNVLQKNPDYMKVVELWGYIVGYTDDGIESNAVEQTTMPDKSFLEEVYALLPLEYVLMKQQIGGQVMEAQSVDATVKSFSDPAVIREQIENFVDSLDMEVEELKKVFNDSIVRRTRKRKLERNRINNIIKRVLEIEKVWMANEKIRLKNKQKRLAEQARKEREKQKELERIQRQQQKAAEAEAKRLAKIAAAEEAKRLKEEQKRLAEEQAVAEQARLLAQQQATEQVAETPVDGGEIPANVEQAVEQVDESAVAPTEQPAEQVDEVAQQSEQVAEISEQVTEDLQQPVAQPDELESQPIEQSAQSVDEDSNPADQSTEVVDASSDQVTTAIVGEVDQTPADDQVESATDTADVAVEQVDESAVAPTEQPAEQTGEVDQQSEQVAEDFEQPVEQSADDQSESVEQQPEQTEEQVDDQSQDESVAEDDDESDDSDDDFDDDDTPSTDGKRKRKRPLGWKDKRRQQRRAPKVKKVQTTVVDTPVTSETPVETPTEQTPVQTDDASQTPAKKGFFSRLFGRNKK